MDSQEKLYTVSFTYKGKEYSGNISTYAECRPETDPMAVWPFAEEVIKPILAKLPNHTTGTRVHDVVIYGPYGEIKLKP